MQNVVSTSNKIAAMFSAVAITTFMLTAYFAPPAAAFSGIVA